MKTEYFCHHCNKPCEIGHNYCDFNCHIAACKADGFKEITPNGLPAKCITGTGLLLECEGGDHPSYIKPVTVTLYGYHYNWHNNTEETGPEYRDTETHALIFQDGTCAVTLFEECYFFWTNNKLKYTSLAFEHYKKYDANVEL